MPLHAERARAGSAFEVPSEPSISCRPRHVRVHHIQYTPYGYCDSEDELVIWELPAALPHVCCFCRHLLGLYISPAHETPSSVHPSVSRQLVFVKRHSAGIAPASTSTQSRLGRISIAAKATRAGPRYSICSLNQRPSYFDVPSGSRGCTLASQWSREACVSLYNLL